MDGGGGERAGNGVDGGLGHAQRHGRHGGGAPGEFERAVRRLAVLHHLLRQPPGERVRGLDAVIAEAKDLLGAGRAHKRDKARDRAPAHGEAERYLRRAEMRAGAHHPQVEGGRQRQPAADGEALYGGNGELLQPFPGRAEPFAGTGRVAPGQHRLVAAQLHRRVGEVAPCGKTAAIRCSEHDGGGFEVVPEAERDLGQFPDRLQ